MIVSNNRFLIYSSYVQEEGNGFNHAIFLASLTENK